MPCRQALCGAARVRSRHGPHRDGAAIGVGGTVIVALAGFWANVKNTTKATALTLRALEITEQGQVAERYTKAIEQLGSENTDVRIGGIYALERIAKNSADDRRTIQFQLGAFVRNHARWPATEGQQHPTATVDEHLPLMQVRAPDIWAAVAVLSRRLPVQDEQPLYLSRVDLRGLRLDDARLPGVVIRHTNLARARLREAHLDQSDLTDADLRQADLEGTQLTGATLSFAYLQGANLSRADLRGANLSDTILDKTTLTGARANDASARKLILLPRPGHPHALRHPATPGISIPASSAPRRWPILVSAPDLSA